MLDYKTLTQKYGSPLYVYDLDKVDFAYKLLKEALPQGSIIYYSLKANPNPHITRHLLDLGCYAEISSRGELEVLLEINADLSRCLYTGPGKTEHELLYAIECNVTFFSVESIEELKLLNGIAMKTEKVLYVLFRINPSSNTGRASIKMTGVPSQFGFDEDEIINIPNSIYKNKNIKFMGFHIYNGSNFKDENELKENFIFALETIDRLQKKLKIEAKVIDIGGGFKAPFGKKESLINYSSIKSEIVTKINKIFKNKPKLAFESGRYLTALSGCLVGTVLSNKVSRGKRYCIVDFGINNLGGMAGLKRVPTIGLELYSADNIRDIVEDVMLVGPLCTPLDYLAKGINMPNFKQGDIVFVPNVGAYGLTASLIGFLSREIPTELIILNDRVRYINKISLKREISNE
ncbi:decarboxylase [Robertmurraya kyonggiensis]|uniref:Decarboxylase n=1 Tax=Robertmurraya kyonggiensis TaxID=1037680 RepID=A0A4V5P1V2_9BACI|nr:decarboxylase [Robertmurraya kyonggiensis]TKC19120.1 decarboxylase [Robertmurraya kyonggiensis]